MPSETPASAAGTGARVTTITPDAFSGRPQALPLRSDPPRDKLEFLKGHGKGSPADRLRNPLASGWVISGGRVRWSRRTAQLRKRLCRTAVSAVSRCLRVHPADFVVAYNFARRPATLRGLTADGAICKARAADPTRFKDHPRRQMTRSYIERSY